MKTLFLTLAFTALTVPALAADVPPGMHRMPDGSLMPNAGMAAASAAAATPAANSGRTVTATVNGLICDFCAQTIHKTLLKEPGVADAAVDLSAKTVTVRLRDGATLDRARLTGLLKDAGYDLTDYQAE